MHNSFFNMTFSFCSVHEIASTFLDEKIFDFLGHDQQIDLFFDVSILRKLFTRKSPDKVSKSGLAIESLQSCCQLFQKNTQIREWNVLMEKFLSLYLVCSVFTLPFFWFRLFCFQKIYKRLHFPFLENVEM